MRPTDTLVPFAGGPLRPTAIRRTSRNPPNTQRRFMPPAARARKPSLWKSSSRSFDWLLTGTGRQNNPRPGFRFLLCVDTRREYEHTCERKDALGDHSSSNWIYHIRAGNWIREYREIYRLVRFPEPERPDLFLWWLRSGVEERLKRVSIEAGIDLQRLRRSECKLGSEGRLGSLTLYFILTSLDCQVDTGRER